MKYLIGLLGVLVAGCGGAGHTDTVINTAQAGTVITPLSVQGTGIHINKQATAVDAYEGGLRVTRDTTGLSGGTHGHVNTANMTRSIAGKDMVQFEWANLTILDNYATRGENVGIYSQANKYSVGPTFGTVSEVTDVTGFAGAQVAMELDIWTSGGDTGSRIGLDIVSGDARQMRNLGRSNQADATTAIRIGQTTSSPWATWGTGIELTGTYRDSVIKVVSPNGQVVFEVKPNGDVYRRGVLLP